MLIPVRLCNYLIVVEPRGRIELPHATKLGY
jgi:hypothetical protein